MWRFRHGFPACLVQWTVDTSGVRVNIYLLVGPLNTAVEAQGALVLDWGRQSHVLAQLQPSMDPAEAQVLVRVMCASPMRPTGLVETMRHLGVDAHMMMRYLHGHH